MKKIASKNYQDITQELGKLSKFAAEDGFKEYVNVVLVPSLQKPWQYGHLISYGVRFLIAIFAFVIIGVPAIVLAAEGSQPGDVLFPVKEAVKDVTIEITFHPQVVVDTSDQIDEIASVQTSDSPAVTSGATDESKTDSSTGEQSAEKPQANTNSQSEVASAPDGTTDTTNDSPQSIAQIQTNVHIQDDASPAPEPSQAPASTGQQSVVESKTLELNVSVKGEEVVKLGL